MRKREELVDVNSCLNKAGLDELIFVLLGRDVAAPAAIRTWARVRVARGKNQATDAQIVEALNLAQQMQGYPCHRRDREHWCDRAGSGGFMGHTCVPAPALEGNFLEVGHNEESHEVVVNHANLDVDGDGCGHIVFSPAEARNLAVLLIEHAHQAEAVKG